MARANLIVTQGVLDAFLSAQESRDVRILKVKIVGEEMVLQETIARQSDVGGDFNYLLVSSLSETEACFALFCNTDDSHGPLEWTLIAWVPDGCRVRDKMLYSSSREDLKQYLGLGYFKSEYGANQLSDITWEFYQNSLRSITSTDVLTETERLILEEKTLTQQESGNVKATALGVIPFQLSSEVIAKLTEFKNDECNWIEVTIESEVVQLICSKTVDSAEDLRSHIDSESASFIMARLSKDDGSQFPFFIFSCPENVPVRVKMTMSSSKASVLAAASTEGLSFEKTFEIRDLEDINDMVKSELSTGKDSAANLNSSSSAAANVTHAKPQRPGRGKAKVSKFSADEE